MRPPTALRSHVQPPPLPVPRSATALRKRPRTDVRSAWSSASSESGLNRPAFSFDQFSVLADRSGWVFQISASCTRWGNCRQPLQQFSSTSHQATAPHAANPAPVGMHPRRGPLASSSRNQRPRSGSELQLRSPSAFKSGSVPLEWYPLSATTSSMTESVRLHRLEYNMRVREVRECRSLLESEAFWGHISRCR